MRFRYTLILLAALACTLTTHAEPICRSEVIELDGPSLERPPTSAIELLGRVEDVQSARLSGAGVGHMIRSVKVAGVDVQIHYIVDVADFWAPDGTCTTKFFMRPATDQERAESNIDPLGRQMDRAFLMGMAGGMQALGQAMDQQIGLPGGSTPPIDPDPESGCPVNDFDSSQDHKKYRNTYAVGGKGGFFSFSSFLYGPACAAKMWSAELGNLDDTRDTPQRQRAELGLDTADALENASLEDLGTVSGVPQQRVVFDGLQIERPVDDGQVMTINRIGMDVDIQNYVTTRTQIDGTMEIEGEIRNISLEQQSRDFRTIAGTDLYEPYEQVQRISGMLSPEQQEQIEEARDQLEDFERQLASMSSMERKMMQNMIGSKLEQVRQLAESGDFSNIMLTTKIEVVRSQSNGLRGH